MATSLQTDMTTMNAFMYSNSHIKQILLKSIVFETYVCIEDFKEYGSNYILKSCVKELGLYNVKKKHFEVLKLLARGLTVREVALKIGYSTRNIFIIKNKYLSKTNEN